MSVTQTLTEFFSSESFMPHGHCFHWQPEIFWIYLLSDAGIAASYYLIPFALIYFVRKRTDVPFEGIFLWFGAFILLCGTTHLMNIWVLWNPNYGAQAVLKAMTAIVSIVTFFLTVKLLPRALALPSASQLAQVNEELRNANRELEAVYKQQRESGQAHLRAVVDNALDGLIAINAKGIIESFNPACERIFGYKATEVMGKNVKMLMPEPYHGEHDGYLKNYLTTGDAKIIGTAGREVTARRKDGVIFPIDLSISSFVLEDGQHFSGIIRDISARKEAESQLRQSKERYDLAVSGSSVGVWDWDVKTSELYWSPLFRHMLGITDMDFRPEYLSFETRLHPEDKEKTVAALMAHISIPNNPVPYEAEYRIRREDGSYIWFYAKGQALWDSEGKATRVAGSVLDITARKEAEQRMEHIVQALTESNAQLERFAYICSHDLQEPLRMITNYTQRLEKHLGNSLDDKGQHYMQYVFDGAQRARQLINDVLTLARIGSENKAFEAVDCNEVMERIAADLQERIREEQATLTYDALPVVQGHKIYVVQVFQNLIGNALKFKSDKPIAIHIGSEQKGAYWQFSITDNGIGIDPEYQEKIFEIFQRLHSRDKYPGTGIGLAIVKKIIDRHGGRIWVHSAPGKGSTFYFTLPHMQIEEKNCA